MFFRNTRVNVDKASNTLVPLCFCAACTCFKCMSVFTGKL